MNLVAVLHSAQPQGHNMDSLLAVFGKGRQLCAERKKSSSILQKHSPTKQHFLLSVRNGKSGMLRSFCEVNNLRLALSHSLDSQPAISRWQSETSLFFICFGVLLSFVFFPNFILLNWEFPQNTGRALKSFLLFATTCGWRCRIPWIPCQRLAVGKAG